MNTVQRIIRAVHKLKPAEFMHLRKELERREKGLWESEWSQTSAAMKRRGLRDQDIDRAVTQRRRENRR